MTTNKNTMTYRKDYQVPPFLVDSIALEFDLLPDKTTVLAKSVFYRNPEATQTTSDLTLLGTKLHLDSVKLDAKILTASAYQLDDEQLVITNVPDKFSLEVQTTLHPAANTELTGLYISNDIFCTQCESEGFRRMTYFPDRPDVMTKFTTKIIADKARYPQLLSNGNIIAQGDLPNERHFVTWQDPFKKPAYLFALVAGDLDVVSDTFVTCTGREVTLFVYVEKGKASKATHALQCLQQAMRWDEETFGREYDLDIYMIVAVHDFNFGAMENKGLNIFNDKYILVDPKTATDQDYENVITVVGHEYFHNWSGNRVTLRDWFQLSLKEGFTVFRDQSFTEDATSKTVARIHDVNTLRTHQFSEDAGPLAHPVRPDAYLEINNFYTATIYNKGAEVIRMLQTICGTEAFRAGTDLYFRTYDGQAVTCDELVDAISAASQRDLSQFKLWYSQAGTPEVTITSEYDETAQTYQLHCQQHIPATPNQATKKPMHIPLKVALLGLDGCELAAEKVLDLTEPKQTFSFDKLKSKPIPSLLRHFSAPVKVDYPYTDAELMFLFAHDSDGFSRWEAGQRYMSKIILTLVAATQQQQSLTLDAQLISTFKTIIADKNIDAFLRAQLITLPSLSYLAAQMATIDIDALFTARNFVRHQLSQQLREDFFALYHLHRSQAEYVYNMQEAGRRSLQNACLGYLRVLADDDDELRQLCVAQFEHANNMTDQLAALVALSHLTHSDRDAALKTFYQTWRHEPLVLDKWFALQACSEREDTQAKVRELTKHADFDLHNPNKVYALLIPFSNLNMVRFHSKDGAGYTFIADKVLELDKINPQVAARVLNCFSQWRRFDKVRQALIEQQLERIQATPALSNNVAEIVSKSLAS